MEDLYDGLVPTVSCSNDILRFGNFPASANFSSQFGSQESDVSDLIKTQISNHPRYPTLISTYIECQKVGAPPEVASLLEEIGEENYPVNNCCQIGVDPELDEFMESYCELLHRYKGKLTNPFDETTTFLNNIEKKLARMEATKLKVIVQNGDQVELSFTREWNSSLEDNQVPLNIDKRFVLLGNSSGFYTYGIYNRLKGWPAFELDNTRIAFKLRKDLFHYMAISDNRQRYMPLPDDRSPERGQALAYPEAVLLVNPLEPEFKGEVDDKYQYSCESKDLGIHGWISNDTGIGFWQISPSYEFRSGGPFKQFLNSHVGPTNLGIFHSTHYSGADMIIKFKDGEQWKKVYGPIFIYVNSLSEGNGNATSKLWEDAKDKLKREGQSWPYSFPASEDFPKSNQRGNVKGRLLVHDRYVSKRNISAKGAYVGLALPGDVGFWQVESKGYQFWSKADEDGCFSIANIRTGKYNLYATVPGFIGDYQYNGLINIAAGLPLYHENSKFLYNLTLNIDLYTADVFLNRNE